MNSNQNLNKIKDQLQTPKILNIFSNMSRYDTNRYQGYMRKSENSPSFSQSRNFQSYNASRYSENQYEKSSPQFGTTTDRKESQNSQSYKAEEAPKSTTDRRKSRLEILREAPDYLRDTQPLKKVIVSGSLPAYRKELIEKAERLLSPEVENEDRGTYSNRMDFNTTDSSWFTSPNFNNSRQYEAPKENEGRFRNGSECRPEDDEDHWKCQICEGLNFPTKTSCFRCEAPKPIDEILRIPVTKLGPPGLFKEGDWQCFNCRNVNFKNRQNCNKCSEPKPAEYVQREKENQYYEQMNKNFGKMNNQFARKESNFGGNNQSRYPNNGNYPRSTQNSYPSTPTGGYQSEKTSWRTNNFQGDQNRNSNDRSRSRSFLKESSNGQSFATNQSFHRFGNTQQGRSYVGGFERPTPKNYLR